MSQDFFFAEAHEGKPVEVLRVGSFVDRNGRDVEIGPDDLEAFVAAFASGAAGQDVPIDLNHERDTAAGWVRRLWREGEKLLADVEWNEIGQRLVGGKVYRYVSATLDLARRVIRSISLVNFPAVKGLRPVELADGAMGLEVEPGLVERIVAAVRAALRLDNDVKHLEEGGEGNRLTELIVVAGSEPAEAEIAALADNPNEEGSMNEEELAQLKDTLRTEIEAEMAAREKNLTEMRAQVRAEVEAELQEALARRGKLFEFAQMICSGEAALSAKPADVVALLEQLPVDLVGPVQDLLKAPRVDLTEHGSSRDGKATLQELPAEFSAALDAKAITLDDLRGDASGLGDLSQYDLSKWQAKE